MRTDDTFEKLEFWVLTMAFVPTLTLHERGYPMVTYSVLFLSFMFINFKLVDELVRGERLLRNIPLLLVCISFILLANLLATRGYFEEAIVDTLILVALIAGYVVVKQFALFVISKADIIQAFLVIFNRHSFIAFGLWLVVLYWLNFIRVPIEVWGAWAAIIPTGILLHGLAFYFFIPGALRWKYPLLSYFFRVLLFCFPMGLAVGAGATILTGDEDGFIFGLFTGVLHFIFTAPTLWLIYRWQMRGDERIFALQSELGRSTANLDLLRSQINPHFLFNALNTIYGLAIQENAPKTSESVEKLGEMMRFMLSENMQERTSLVRELEYLDNYISIQKLRTDSNSGVKIQVDIQKEIAPETRISPMLLIPFVENAFKHGISHREESYIKISLELKGTTLYFDVLNSRHPKTENDPEKDSNGIGLANVKHRLQHMYPRKHELLIRETAHDFFVHLQMQLD